MAQQTYGDADERWNRVNDDDALWGPFADIRPAKNQVFSSTRAFVLSAAVGGFFGLALDLIWALSAGRASLPSAYAMPLILTLAYFVGFQLTLGPAWNRRAYWLRRREEYLARDSS
jgi:hypothetical protein